MRRTGGLRWDDTLEWRARGDPAVERVLMKRDGAACAAPSGLPGHGALRRPGNDDAEGAGSGVIDCCGRRHREWAPGTSPGVTPKICETVRIKLSVVPPPRNLLATARKFRPAPQGRVGRDDVPCLGPSLRSVRSRTRRLTGPAPASSHPSPRRGEGSKGHRSPQNQVRRPMRSVVSSTLSPAARASEAVSPSLRSQTRSR